MTEFDYGSSFLMLPVNEGVQAFILLIK